MKFIFPQNYNFKIKFLGFLDYSTIIFDVICFLIILLFVSFFKFSLYFKILLIITLFFPLFLFSIVGFNGENIIYVFFYVFKFLIKSKVYLYNKEFS